jgi:hypothetical protein
MEGEEGSRDVGGGVERRRREGGQTMLVEVRGIAMARCIDLWRWTIEVCDNR